MDNILKELISELSDKTDVNQLKKDICKKYKISKVPSNIEILNLMNKEERKKYRKYLITKPSRTLSGVAPIAIMTKPAKCPHGKCIYCPGGPGSEFGDVPQSYTGREPASMRAARAKYDPYIQVFNRLEQYIVLGHTPEKCEVIVMGGTFPALKKTYREEFVKYIYKAMNDFSRMFFKEKGFDYSAFKKFFELPGSIEDSSRTARIQEKLKQMKGKCSLEKEQIKNENAKIRCVGLTIETRPDCAGLKEANEMLRLGCTRVELGIQSVYNDILKFVERGHTVADSIKAIRILKDLGFKINCHYMPGLPGSSVEKDIAGLNELFLNPDFRSDMLKIYPCIVMRGTKLYDIWKAGRYKPLTTRKAANIIAEFKRDVPPYARIMRVNRDIPTYATEAGVDVTNLRQVVSDVMKKKGYKCRCIRCRETPRNKKVGHFRLNLLSYSASCGREFFISFDDENNNIIGFCRMRFPSQPLRKEITPKTALIRELHVYSEAIGISDKAKVSEKSLQHRGFGKRLLKEAERIALQGGMKKILVISGVGAREYYRKLGYKRDGAYMGKTI